MVSSSKTNKQYPSEIEELKELINRKLGACKCKSDLSVRLSKEAGEEIGEIG